MELNIFPEPAVAGPLSRHYVEARLHTDSHDKDKRPALRALQLEMQGSNFLPYYILFDPRTKRELAIMEGASDALLDATVFRDFLLEGVDASTTTVAAGVE